MGVNHSTEGPLVSVVVPFYNVEDYAGPCLASLVAQTFEDCEFVCVDDGSTDGTPDVLARYVALDGRIRIVRIEHAGLEYYRRFCALSALLFAPSCTIVCRTFQHKVSFWFAILRRSRRPGEGRADRRSGRSACGRRVPEGTRGHDVPDVLAYLLGGAR